MTPHRSPLPPAPAPALVLVLAAALAALILLPAAGCHRPATEAPAGAGPARLTVTVAPVTNAAWDRTVAIVGTLFPKDEATIAARVEGQVESTFVDFGDRLREGQDLAAIDTTAYSAHLEQATGNRAKAQANLDNARHNFDRVQRLREGGIASDADFDTARSQLDQWEAELKAAIGAESVARLNVERSQVRAPFDGAVARRVVGRGDFVKVGSPLYEVVNDAVLKFIFHVPERHASRVAKGLPVTFGVDNYPDETFRGRVYLISPSVATASRTFGVGALVTNTGFRLKASSFARGELVLQTGVPTPVIPVDAVVSFAGVTRVFVVDGDTARSRAITVGRIRDGLQEVLEGVKAGERVVVSGQSKVTDGAAVTVRDPSAPGPATPGNPAGPPALPGRPPAPSAAAPEATPSTPSSPAAHVTR